MKKEISFFAVLSLALSLAACQKNTGEVSAGGEKLVCISPVTTSVTKAPVAGTSFPDNRTMILSAYYNADEGTSANYFSGVSFVKAGGFWTSGKYWPANGSLDMLAYSADGLSVDPTYDTNVSEGVTLDIPDNSSVQCDILWGYASDRRYSSEGTAISFKHAGASIAFTAKSNIAYNAGTNIGITIESIVLNAVQSSGMVKLNSDLTCVWSDLGDTTDITLPGLTDGYHIPAKAVDLSETPFGIGEKGLLVLPQTSTSFTVTYTIHNGKDDSGNKMDNKGLKFTYDIDGDWVYAKKYVYALRFELNSISVIPSITDWADGGTTDVDIPQKVVAECAVNADAGAEKSIPAIKMKQNSRMRIDWGDGNHTSYSSGAADTVMSPAHTYRNAYEGSVKIISNAESVLEAQLTEKIATWVGFVIYDSEIISMLETPNAICFSASSQQTVSLTDMSQFPRFEKNEPVLEFSYDGAKWTAWDYSALTFGISGHPLVYIRGKNASGFSTGSLKFSYFCFGDGQIPVECDGSIMSLIDWEDKDLKVIPCEYCFYQLFMECSVMVSGPELPASALKPSCYGDMFAGCKSLIYAPELPAVELAASCYSGMFALCSSLVSAPELPAAELAEGCYSGMFGRCSALNYVKMMATDISAEFCLDGWLRDVHSTGTFVKNSSAVWSDVDVVPSGWTIITAAE